MGALGEMSLYRWLIVGFGLGSLVLGYFAQRETDLLATLETEVQTKAPLLVNRIQKKAIELEQLQKAADKEGLLGQSDPQSYVRGVAHQDQVEIGQVDITPGQTTVAAGVTDRTYKVLPQDRKRAFRLWNIANFLYRLEEKSRRVKVTSLKLDPVARMKTDEIGKDQNWSFSATLTSRQADG